MCQIYGFEGSFDQFFDHFLADNVAYGSYWENLRSWWVLRDTPNVLVLSYEEMHADLQSVTHQVARFFNKELTDAQVESIVQHCSLDSMRANPMTNAKFAQRPYAAWNNLSIIITWPGQAIW